MKTIGILKNAIQDYAWGSLTAIPELLGQPVTGTPQAELWMGAHPKAPSQVFHGGKWESLIQAIETQPVDVLGKEVAEKFRGKLPYLFKVLAAAKPLSIQAHPNLQQAREGFERENRQGISLTASNRNYKDENHKPECICALTRFWGMNGFRSAPEIIRYLCSFCQDVLQAEIALLESRAGFTGIKAPVSISADAVAAKENGCHSFRGFSCRIYRCERRSRLPLGPAVASRISRGYRRAVSGDFEFVLSGTRTGPLPGLR